MKKFMLIMLLSLFLSLSVVCASDEFVFDENINCIDNDINGFESNLHDNFNYLGNDEILVDEFVDDIPDSYIIFDENDELLDDEIEPSIINNPSVINNDGLLLAGIHTTTESSDTKYVTVYNYNELSTAFENLDDNYNNAVITLSGSNEYLITSPLIYGTNQNIKNVTIQGNGHIIDGLNINSFLEIKKDYTINLYNITIQNTISDSNGGAIKNSGRLNIYNSCLKEQYGDMVGVLTKMSGLLPSFGYVNIFSTEILSTIVIEGVLPASVLVAIPILITNHWDAIDEQEKYKDEYVTSNDMENYAITDGYLSFSMHDYDAYNNITYNSPQELEDNNTVVRIKISRWGSLDYTDMVVYDTNGKRNLTEEEFNYYNGRYDSIYDYYLGGIL